MITELKLKSKYDRCGRCGYALLLKDKNTGRPLCKTCKCTCDTSDNCLVHWNCDCSWGGLCEYHKVQSQPVIARYNVLTDRNPTKILFEFLVEQTKSEKKIEAKIRRAWNYCGSCSKALIKSTSKTERLVCPSGCTCTCNQDQCLVHWRCGCGYDTICHYHSQQHPEHLQALLNRLPDEYSLKQELIKIAAARKVELKPVQPKQLTTTIEKPKTTLPATKKVSHPTFSIEKQTAPKQPTQLIQSKAKASGTLKQPKTIDHSKHLEPYLAWLSKQPLSIHAKRAYQARIKVFISYLQEFESDTELTRVNQDSVARDFKQYLKRSKKLQPASLNAYLAALDNFFGFLGFGKAKVTREDLPQEAPQALNKQEQKRLLRAIERTRRAKDRAILNLLMYTGMRISECAGLDNDDVFITGRKTRAIIRSGKGNRYREVPLNSKVCEAFQKWLDERNDKFADRNTSTAFFLNPQGQRLLPGGIDLIVRKIGKDCGLDLSAHVLRHTCLTNLVRAKNDLIMVADIAGHKKLDTTKRYTLPTASDKAKALESLLVAE